MQVALRTKLAVTAAALALPAGLLIGAGTASAAGAATGGGTQVHPLNWTSSISGVRANNGWSSRRWSDESYTQIIFKGCTSTHGQSVTIELRRDISGAPDVSYGTHVLTNCFHGKSSSGTWDGLPSGNYFFQIDAVDGSPLSDDPVSVSTVSQDTTKADG